MKRFLIFIISFIALFFLFQVISGFILTWMYTPDIETAWDMNGHLSEATITRSHRFDTFLIAFLSASIAFFIQKKVKQR